MVAPPASLRKILCQVYCNSLIPIKSKADVLAQQLSIAKESVEKLGDEAESKGLLLNKTGVYTLTKAGRANIKVVMTGGVFDIIHTGHLHTLSSAKKLGDVLVVSVARNSTVMRNRGRAPIFDEKSRVELVGAIRLVDVALLGSEKDIFETVGWVAPNVIALGYDQKHDEEKLVEESRRKGIKVKVMRLDSPIPHIKSSKLKTNQQLLEEL